MGLGIEAYKYLIRWWAQHLSPHATHWLGEVAMQMPLAPMRLINGLGDPRLQVELAGVPLPGPVGAAAGLDKRCIYLHNLLSIGFGYAVGGTVTPEPHGGNPRPSLLCRIPDRALVNAMGFPNHGWQVSAKRMARRPGPRKWISISADSPEEMARLFSDAQQDAPAVEVNMSSPNRQTLKRFQEPKALKGLLAELAPLKRKPMFAKLPRRDDHEAVLRLGEAALEGGADGLVLANSLPIEEPKLAMGRGGLTGAPLLDGTLRLVQAASRRFGRKVPLVASGGASSAQHVWTLMEAGAHAVQVYSGLIYEGPWLPATINGGLRRMLDRAGAAGLADLRG